MSRLWMATGLLVEGRIQQLVGGLFAATSAEEAVGMLMARECPKRPASAAHAFKALDCTQFARDFVAENPQ